MSRHPRQATLGLWNERHPALEAWWAAAAPGAAAQLEREDGSEGAALRLDLTPAGHGSWAILRHEAPLTLPKHYVVVLRVRGTLAPTELQVKLVGAEGSNVWWWRLRPYNFSPVTQRLVLHAVPCGEAQ